MKTADWDRIMQPGAIIRAIPDPRLSLRVGPYDNWRGARIDGQASFRSYKEHARLMHALTKGGCYVEDLDPELRSIALMPLGNHPERGLTCES